MYAAVATRPDIAFPVNKLASFTANPTMCHWTAAKHVLRYLKGTKNIGITYSKPESSNMTSQIISLDILMPALPIIMIVHQYLAMYTLLPEVRSYGDLENKMWYPYLLLKLNIYVYLMQHVKPHGYATYIKRLVIHRKNQL